MINLCISCFPWSSIWAFLSVIATFLIAGIAWNELEKNRRITASQYIRDCTKEFYNPETSELLMLFEFEKIEYYSENKKGASHFADVPDDLSIFKVTIKGYKRNDKIPAYLLNHVNIYSGYEIDDLLLGPIEDIGLLYKSGIMDLWYIDEAFGHYIALIGKNKIINNYIVENREYYNDPKIFSKFEDLVKKITKDDKFMFRKID